MLLDEQEVARFERCYGTLVSNMTRARVLLSKPSFGTIGARPQTLDKIFLSFIGATGYVNAPGDTVYKRGVMDMRRKRLSPFIFNDLEVTVAFTRAVVAVLTRTGYISVDYDEDSIRDYMEQKNDYVNFGSYSLLRLDGLDDSIVLALNQVNAFFMPKNDKKTFVLRQSSYRCYLYDASGLIYGATSSYDEVKKFASLRKGDFSIASHLTAAHEAFLKSEADDALQHVENKSFDLVSILIGAVAIACLAHMLGLDDKLGQFFTSLPSTVSDVIVKLFSTKIDFFTIDGDFFDGEGVFKSLSTFKDKDALYDINGVVSRDLHIKKVTSDEYGYSVVLNQSDKQWYLRRVVRNGTYPVFIFVDESDDEELRITQGVDVYA